MAATLTRWSSPNWTGGKVTLFNALGLGSWKVSYPKLTPTLAGAVAQDAAAGGGSGTGGGTGGTGGATTTGGSGTTQQVPGGGTYTYAQLEDLWVQAGGNPAKKAIAAAIAMAESSGRVNASLNDTNGTQDRGLWQINSSHGSQSVFTPLQNARSAVAISSNGSNWSPWVTYQSGAYKKYLQ